MQNGCNVYMDSYMALNGSCFMVTWTIFINHLLVVGLIQNQDTRHSKCSQPLIYSILSSARTHMNRMKEHLVEGPVTCDFTLHLRVCDLTV
jgi:uncharacterized protein YwbE